MRKIHIDPALYSWLEMKCSPLPFLTFIVELFFSHLLVAITELSAQPKDREWGEELSRSIYIFCSNNWQTVLLFFFLSLFFVFMICHSLGLHFGDMSVKSTQMFNPC
uniref:Uncharacterized protein n=1 Tax=Micrurus corallinus TaxID=54390 RepID=A0A2D4G8N9_MICCO